MRIVEEDRSDLLTDVSDSSMIIASDYSGQHKRASHEAYAFLVTTERSLHEWLPELTEFRQQWLPDNRRIAFKNVNEKLRWGALPAFLSTVENLDCNLIAILVDRRVGSFSSGGKEALVEALPNCFPVKAKDGTVEKMLRLASFVALILAGLRREEQTSHWISDHDEALDSHEKREMFARLATYLTFGLTGWRKAADHYFGTTESPLAPLWSEDLASVADLVAGSYCKMSEHLPSFLGQQKWTVSMGSHAIEDRRARAIGNWLAQIKGPLRHVLLRLEQSIDGSVNSSAQAFVKR